MVVIFRILLSSHPVQSQRHLFLMPSPNPAVIVLIRDNSDEKEPLALCMTMTLAKIVIGYPRGENLLTVGMLSAAGERGLPCRNEKLNVVLFKNAGLPEFTMPDVFQESLVMIPAKAAKLERLIAKSRFIDNMNEIKRKKAAGYGAVIVKVGNHETTYSCVADLINQNKEEKFIIINVMITTSPGSGVKKALCEVIYLAQQKNPDRGYVVKQSRGRFGADALNMYPGYSIKFADFNQATIKYDLAIGNSRVKATQKKHGMNQLTAFLRRKRQK